MRMECATIFDLPYRLWTLLVMTTLAVALIIHAGL